MNRRSAFAFLLFSLALYSDIVSPDPPYALSHHSVAALTGTADQELQERQWQSAMINGAPVVSIVTAPQKQALLQVVIVGSPQAVAKGALHPRAAA
ncbi:MAG TPA: hypothetical protein VFQ82_14380, partial [Stellaceae bacterium]|nr:hypothetical protein [Stellaceae bacterium]